MAKRRKVLLGLGALAFGSGAMSVNAAFNNSVDPGGDFRAISAEQLVVEPGISFRDGSNPSDSYDNTLDGPKFYSEDFNDFYSTDAPSANASDSLGNDLSLSDLPAISVTNAQNGQVIIKIATLNSANTVTFADALQVRNDGDTSKDVAVKFSAFGVDVQGGSGSQSGTSGVVYQNDVIDAYTFYDDSGNPISTNPNPNNATTPYSSVGDQEVENTVTINSGNVEQIDIEVSFDSSIVSDIATAANVTGSPFTGDQDTVQLVDTVRFGTDPTNVS